jgi:ankyrin repeat protein
MNELHHAAVSGDIQTVKLLLDNGADVDAKWDGYRDGATPLHLAAAKGHTETAKLLLDRGALINAENERGDWRIYGTPLDAAASEGHTETVKLLLDRGARVEQQTSTLSPSVSSSLDRAIHAGLNNFRAITRTTPTLHRAIFHPKVVKLLLDKGADVNVAQKDGATALHAAASEGHTETVKLLLDRGADVNAENDSRETPLHLAVTALAQTPASATKVVERYTEIVAILRAHGGGPEPSPKRHWWSRS